MLPISSFFYGAICWRLAESQTGGHLPQAAGVKISPLNFLQQEDEIFRPSEQ